MYVRLLIASISLLFVACGPTVINPKYSATQIPLVADELLSQARLSIVSVQRSDDRPENEVLNGVIMEKPVIDFVSSALEDELISRGVKLEKALLGLTMDIKSIKTVSIAGDTTSGQNEGLVGKNKVEVYYDPGLQYLDRQHSGPALDPTVNDPSGKQALSGVSVNETESRPPTSRSQTSSNTGRSERVEVEAEFIVYICSSHQRFMKGVFTGNSKIEDETGEAFAKAIGNCINNFLNDPVFTELSDDQINLFKAELPNSDDKTNYSYCDETSF